MWVCRLFISTGSQCTLFQLTPSLMLKCVVCMYLDEAQRAEVNRMLCVMFEAQEQDVNTQPAYQTTLSHSLAQKALLSHCLAMLWFLCNDHEKVNFCPLIFEFSLTHTPLYLEYTNAHLFIQPIHINLNVITWPPDFSLITQTVY